MISPKYSHQSEVIQNNDVMPIQFAPNKSISMILLNIIIIKTYSYCGTDIWFIHWLHAVKYTDRYCTGSIIATCKRPIDIQNGNIFVTPGGGLKKGTSEQQQAVYQCDDGYTLIGNSTRDCNDGRWEGLAPQMH